MPHETASASAADELGEGVNRRHGSRNEDEWQLGLIQLD